MKSRVIKNICIISLVLNTALVLLLSICKPLYHTSALLYGVSIEGFLPREDQELTIDEQTAAAIAASTWQNSLRDKDGNCFVQPENGKMYVHIYHNLDLWVVESTLEAGRFGGTPCAVLSSKGDVLAVFYSYG